MTFWEVILLWYLSGIICCILCCAIEYKKGEPITPFDIVASIIFSVFGPLILIPFVSDNVSNDFWNRPLLQRKDKQK